MENEIFKPVFGYEGIYEISNYGRLRSLKCSSNPKRTRGIRIVKGSLHRGYIYYKLSKLGQKYVAVGAHRLVALHFLNKPVDKDTVNHIDSNIKNNYVLNLEWVTIGENIRHYWNNKPKDKKVTKVHTKKKKIASIVQSLLIHNQSK